MIRKFGKYDMRQFFWKFGSRTVKYNIRQIYFGNLIVGLCCYCRDNIKHVFLSKHLFQRTQQHGGRKNPRSNDKPL